MIDIRGLQCGYGSKVVIDGLDLAVLRKDFLGIIGPNGSGKTTLFKALTGLIRPRSGSISLDGININTMTAKTLARRIAVVSQNIPDTTMVVREFVLLGRVPHYTGMRLFESAHDVTIAEKAMELTGVIGLHERYLSEISGGEAQLALIARALTQEPEVLLLDEPTAHLDIAHQVKIMDLIKRLNGELDLTVIVILHDLNLASEYCSRLALMDNGRIRNIGTPDEVIHYRDIEDVYKTVVVVERNPLSGKPFVLVVPEEVKNLCKK